MVGFYRSKKMIDGNTSFDFVTQFAPADARRAFPCWGKKISKKKNDIVLGKMYNFWKFIPSQNSRNLYILPNTKNDNFLI